MHILFYNDVSISNVYFFSFFLLDFIEFKHAERLQ